jgi:sialidase-1
LPFLLLLAATVLFQQQDLFHQGDAGVHTYRIPALVETQKGVLIAVADARHDGTGDLPARISLVIRRSFDKGRTWTPAKTLREVAEGGVGDASLLLDRTNGRVWCVHAYGPPGVGFGTPNAAALQVNAITSDDDGASWSAAVDLTPQIQNSGWRGMFATSGTDIQLSTGRLLVPLVVRDAKGVIGSRNIYSDDHGVTWHAGVSAGQNTDESHNVELADGTVLQNMRNGNTRAVARSHDGGVTFGEMSHDAALIDPSCNAGIVRYHRGRRDVLLFTNAASSSKRERLTIRMSLDSGHTWPVSRVIHEGPAAYSTVVVLRDGTIGVLYERGDKHSVERITFARFDLKWVSGKRAR